MAQVEAVEWCEAPLEETYQFENECLADRGNPKSPLLGQDIAFNLLHEKVTDRFTVLLVLQDIENSR